MLYYQPHKTLPKNKTKVKVQQMPKTEEIDSKIEISCLKWTIYIGRRKVCVNYKTDSDELNIVKNRSRNRL